MANAILCLLDGEVTPFNQKQAHDKALEVERDIADELAVAIGLQVEHNAPSSVSDAQVVAAGGREGGDRGCKMLESHLLAELRGS